MCVQVHKYNMGHLRIMPGVGSIAFYFIPLRQGPSLNLELGWWTASFNNLLCTSPIRWGYRHVPGLYVAFNVSLGDLN